MTIGLAIALATIALASPVCAAGAPNGEIKKLEGIVGEMEKLKQGADPYAQAGLTNAQGEVNGAIQDLQQTPPDNASAIQHKKKAAGLCVAVIALCVDTSDVIEELGKSLVREGGLSNSDAKELNKLVDALLAIKKLGALGKGDPAAWLAAMAYKQIESAIYDLLNGGWPITQKRIGFKWLIHSILECYDPSEAIDEVLDALVMEGGLSASQRAKIKAKIKDMLEAKKNGASQGDLVAMDQEICRMLYDDDDKEPPQSHIVFPLAGEEVSGIVGCLAEQADGQTDGVLTLWHLTGLTDPTLGGFLGGAEGEGVFLFEFDSAAFPDGEYQLTCTMYDAATNPSEAGVEIMIVNLLP